MGILITQLERIRILQRENARLRALVGEPVPSEPAEETGEQTEPVQTLVQKTDTMSQDIDLIAEALLL